MSGAISGINSAGQFVTRDFVVKSNNLDQVLKDNGITDTDLCSKGNSVGNSLDFLDTLTPDQLKETTVASVGSGCRVITYGDLKLFEQLEQGLGDKEQAFLQGGSMISPTAMTPANMSGTDTQALEVQHLIADLQADKPGCATEAEEYLSGKTNLPAMTSGAALAQMQADDAYGAYGGSLGVCWKTAGETALTLLKDV